MKDVTDWIILQGVVCNNLADLAQGVLGRLVHAGLPAQRLQISMPSLHPQYRAIAVTTHVDRPASVENNEHGEDTDLGFLRSPIRYLIGEDRPHGRWNLRVGEGISDFPLLKKLALEGCTDYSLHLLRYPQESFILGMAVSITSIEPSGFSDADLRSFETILPALGLAVYRMSLSQTTADTLRFYVGAQTSTRILSGEIQRGKGQPIFAAILLADLKGFTHLNEVYPPGDLVVWLNEHFEAIGGAVDSEGGEILKLMGDSLLAIFPIDPKTSDIPRVCRAALDAASKALAATAALNATRARTNAPAIGVDVVLHLGEVFYGNVGTAHRLDFTVIGRVVNEAARLEGLCDEVERPLVVSQSFADHSEMTFENLGRFHLKGVSEPQNVFGLASHV